MSSRYKRIASKGKKFARTTYRNAKPFLKNDQSGQCAYSMLHYLSGGGETAYDVDHFNPRKKKNKAQYAKNLLFVSRHTNSKKRDTWPTKEQLGSGVRFLNAYEEEDYGVHIFEDPETHRVWGSTPAGKYQVAMMDLNAEHLVVARRERSRFLEEHFGTYLEIILQTLDGIEDLSEKMREMISRQIPPIALREEPKRRSFQF